MTKAAMIDRLDAGNIRRALTCILAFLALLFAVIGDAAEMVVRHPRPFGAYYLNQKYFVDLLDMALRSTVKTDGPYKMAPTDVDMNQGRAVLELETSKHIDVLWTMTSIERELRLKPIRVPLLKGLLGYRVFFIRKADQEKFAKIKTLADLAPLRAGSGEDWPDTTILRSNGLTVATATRYSVLMKMLRTGVIDYFPRGVTEVWDEYSAQSASPSRGDAEIAIEENLALHYQAPIYYFFDRKNILLADRVERGLRILIENGDFDRYFHQHSIVKTALEHLNLPTRTLLELKDPSLSIHTPIKDDKLWYHP